VMASPATRRRAAEYGVSLSGVTGTGPQGRIQRGDLEAHVRGRSLPTESGSPTQEIAITGVRRIIAQRMSEAKRNIPHFTYVEEVDMTALTALRDHLRSTPQYAGLTFLPFVVVALTRVLADFPQCNALYDADRAVVVRHRAVHVGIATQTRDGLKVPVLRDASGKGLIDIAQQIKQITEAARDNKLKATQMQGSTITITSLGKLAGVVFTPIINPPEVAIVGLNKIMQRPVVVNGSLAIRSMMNLSSSFDHRFVDGFDAASMIAALKERLENPATLFF
jgi:2-oxoisovalerate dehydrogenase E2 component (dihydrolipoyl transacylase)